MEDFVTIAVYLNREDAELIRAQLLEHDIESFLEESDTSSETLDDENTGTVKLNVTSENAEQARLIIRRIDAEGENIPIEEDENDEENKRWKEELQLQEERNLKGSKWGFIIAGIIGLVAIAWLYLKK